MPQSANPRCQFRIYPTHTQLHCETETPRGVSPRAQRRLLLKVMSHFGTFTVVDETSESASHMYEYVFTSSTTSVHHSRVCTKPCGFLICTRTVAREPFPIFAYQHMCKRVCVCVCADAHSPCAKLMHMCTYMYMAHYNVCF